MYQIKRGDEVVLSEVDIDMAAEIFFEIIGFSFNKKPTFSPDIISNLNKLASDANLNLTIMKE